MKVNKKVFFIVPTIIAILLFAGLYVYFNKEDSYSFSSSERKWLSQNRNKVENIEIISDYPIYGNRGVFSSFVDSLKEATKLDFNVVPYYRANTTNSKDFKFKILKENTEITSNDIFLNEDVYVAIGKTEKKLDQISDFENFTLGVFTSDVGDISYYLKKGRTLTYKTYDNAESLFKALDNSDVDMVIVPNIMYLDYTISNNKYHINYIFTEITNKIVLSLSSRNTELNNIVRKYFNKWKEESFVETYNNILLDYYVEQNNINDKTRAEILSKTYVYGFVQNHPYETLVKNKLVGISAEYINRVARLSGIEFEYKKFDTYSELKKAIDAREIDIFFNPYEIENNNYKKTVSTFIEKYAVLGKLSDSNVINSFESLKGHNISVLENTALYTYFKNNSKAKINKYEDLKQLLKNNTGLIVVDNELYNYYRNSKFKDYELLYTDIMTNDYYFMISNEYEGFYNLFNYIINTNSYYNYRNSGLNSLNVSILKQSSFEELYLILLALVLIPILIFMVFFATLKKKKKVKAVKKEERKKYTDMLTSLKNRNYLNLNIKSWNKNPKYPQSIIIIDLNSVNYVNDNHGYEAGDQLIVKAASLLLNTQLEKSEILRIDGNEFLIYLVGYSEQQVSTYTKKISKEMKNLPYGFGAAVGYSMIVDDIKTVEDAINEATLDMKANKEEYK